MAVTGIVKLALMLKTTLESAQTIQQVISQMENDGRDEPTAEEIDQVYQSTLNANTRWENLAPEDTPPDPG